MYLELSHLCSIIFSNSLIALMINIVGEWTLPNKPFQLGRRQGHYLHLIRGVRGVLVRVL